MEEKKVLSRRDFLRLSVGITATSVAILAGCQPPPAALATPTPLEEKPAPAPAKKNVLEWWWGWGGTTGINAMNAVAEAFNAKNLDFSVNPLNTNMGEKLLPAIAGGTPPDVAVGNIMFAELSARGSFMQLDDYFAASKVIQKEDIIPSLWTDATWQGHIYGLAACEVGPRMGMCYNLDLVEKAGLDPNNPPLIWDELYDWHVKMTTFDSAGNIEILGFDPLDAMGGRIPTSDASFFWGDSFGFEFWNQTTMKFNFDNEKMVASLYTIKKFYDLVGAEKIEGYRTSYGTWTQSPTASFPAGVEGVVLNGYWTPGELVHSAPERRFGFTWAPNSPDRRGKKFQNVGGHPVVLPKGIKHPDQSFAFLEYLTMPESMEIILKTTGWLGPRLSWLKTVDPTPYPGLDFFLKSITDADELRPCPLCPIEGFVGQKLNDTWDATKFGDKTPEQAAKDLQAVVTEELRKQFPDIAG